VGRAAVILKMDWPGVTSYAVGPLNAYEDRELEPAVLPSVIP
jgi:hypothetical protein